MIKQSALCAALVAATLSVLASGKKAAPNGGMLCLNGKGQVAIVNTCEASTTTISDSVSGLSNMLMLHVVAMKGSWTIKSAAADFKATGANAAIFVVNDRALPMSLVALESKWGVVNAAGLDDACLKREIIRVATVVLGGASSKYAASAMRPVYSVEDLKKAGNLMTIDSLMAIFPNLESLGLHQFKRISYRSACEEGLAPAPTNDIQKAIWDKVHQLPTKPITIKPETKPVKE